MNESVHFAMLQGSWQRGMVLVRKKPAMHVGSDLQTASTASMLLGRPPPCTLASKRPPVEEADIRQRIAACQPRAINSHDSMAMRCDKIARSRVI